MNSRLPLSSILLLFPAFVLLGIVIVVPLARVLLLSFTQTGVDMSEPTSWIGFGQHVRLWQDGRWWTDLSNTITFTLISVAFELVIGLGFALALSRRTRGIGMARAAMIVPWAVPTAVMALAWAWIFNDVFGVANDILLRTGVLSSSIAWLGQQDTAMAAMIVAEIWKTTPFVGLILLAGLQGIPDHVIEAGRVDGLSRWRILRHITIPLLMPFILAALAFRLIQAYSAFDIVYIMTGGGPGGSTETVSLYAYQNYFRYLDFGYASAIAIQAMGLAAVLILGARWIVRMRSTEDD